jgi:peptidyl-prolyl cis-trans isomerase B (cyclophilin B)
MIILLFPGFCQQRGQGHNIWFTFHCPLSIARCPWNKADIIFVIAEPTMTIVRLTTSKGIISLELFPNEAPGTVANFVKLAEEGFYDGLAFHRVIPNFVIQGGCPNSREGAEGGLPGTGGPGWKIKCETENNPHVHELGALSMAHAGKDTGGSQFFIVNGERNSVSHLDGKHTVFGKCCSKEDIDVVQSIRAMDRIEKAEVAEQ